MVNDGVWYIYGVQERNKAINDTDYLQILENAKNQIRFIDEKVQNRNAIKIWMGYPECFQSNSYRNMERDHISKKMNDLIQEHIQQRADWIFFRLPTPNIPRFCEGFHVRNEWTRLENEIMTSVVCNLTLGT